jgi:ubiquinone/menaquinone biosynthesis C-methylase UbiE
MSFVILPLYIYFGIIRFKKRFNEKRLVVLEKIINLAEIKGNEFVLDLGTGPGMIAIEFAKRLKDGKAIGIDKYPFQNDNITTIVSEVLRINYIGHTIKNAIRNAKIEKVEKKCEFIKADITNPLEFKNEYFDVIISSQTLYCISEKKRIPIFKEIDRVLKKNGKIILFESSHAPRWKMNNVKDYFLDIGYDVRIIDNCEFKTCQILVGQKIK